MRGSLHPLCCHDYDVAFRKRHRITLVIWSEARLPLPVLVRQLLVHSCTEYRLYTLNRRYVRTKILFQDSFLLLLSFLQSRMERKRSSSRCMFCQKSTASMGGMRKARKVLVRICEGKRSFARCRPR